jgi:methylenetetrahydrofolate reductase (NADPH)
MNAISNQPARLPLSFEFFPPKTPEGAAKLAQVRQQLYALGPDFCSVTYGASGTTQDGTFQTVCTILQEGRLAAPHFSCIGATRESVRAQLAQFDKAGIKHVVALRGDIPSTASNTLSEWRYASDLVAFIRAETGQKFQIMVAAYPEKHPKAASVAADLPAFCTKVKAGANAAITQMFFNADAYFKFRDEAVKLGVDVPIIAGIMPITNATGLMRFADTCGTEIPRWIRLRLQDFEHDAASIKAFGLDVIGRLCEQLCQGGAPGFHWYTMNQSAVVLEVYKRFNQ